MADRVTMIRCTTCRRLRRDPRESLLCECGSREFIPTRHSSLMELCRALFLYRRHINWRALLPGRG